MTVDVPLFSDTAQAVRCGTQTATATFLPCQTVILS